MKLSDHFSWHRDRLPTPPPRLHMRGVFVDDTGLGSELGSPAFTREFRDWLEREFAVRVERYEGRACDHPTLSVAELRAGAVCPTCDGSGRRSGERTEYRWPIKAAMARVRGMGPWHADGPTHHTVLLQLVLADFDLGRVQAVLLPTWPCVAVDVHLVRHAHHAEHRLRAVYSEVELPPLPRPGRELVGRSESQAIAEAAA